MLFEEYLSTRTAPMRGSLTPHLILRHGRTGPSLPLASAHKGRRPWRRIPLAPTDLANPPVVGERARLGDIAEDGDLRVGQHGILPLLDVERGRSPGFR
jgi:hypothetical protein